MKKLPFYHFVVHLFVRQSKNLRIRETLLFFHFQNNENIYQKYREFSENKNSKQKSKQRYKYLHSHQILFFDKAS